MTLSRIHSVSLLGLETLCIEVEVDAIETPGAEKNVIVIVGLPDATVKESRDRVMAALRNSGYPIAAIYCTINLAPGDLRKEGALYDLPIALGLLHSLNKIPNTIFKDYLIVGEMGLSGELRPVQGALAMAMFARERGLKGLLVPAANAKEAATVQHIHVIPIAHLKDAVAFALDANNISPLKTTISESIFFEVPPLIDFSDIKGQVNVKRAMEIAAAGGHNVVMSGPPGSGKTMMAKAMIGIMPELSVEESLEITRIHSIAGLMTEGQSVVSRRPFRSPHHTVSYAGLIGGGTNPRPGEVSLAHQGILFLDELPEFSRMVLEVLRQPLEDRKVTISRANGNFTFPTNFICIAAMNPCPCGYLGHPDKTCTDTSLQVNRYRSKISGPLWDRMDIHIDVPALRYHDIMEGPIGESSSVIRDRVKKARQRQYERFGKVKTNSLMSAREVKQFAPLDSACQDLLRHAVDVTGISARACDRLLRVATTIADLEGAEKMGKDHLMEAISFRNVRI